MGILENTAVKGFIRMCNDGWNQGWHERNGGNLTYRMKPEDVEDCRSDLSLSAEFTPLGVTAANLGGQFFIATGSGKYLRNVKDDPENNICIVELNENGSGFRIVWGLISGGRPTSELPTHIMNHSVKTAADESFRVIYHAHTPSLIALTYVLPLDSRCFSRILWQSATECPVVFPAGVGVVPWMVPGGSDIAVATSKLMLEFDAAVWAHHGLFCSGRDFDETFGLMHTIEKSADIYVRAMSTGLGIRQTITDENLRAIAKDFGVTLREDFLD